MTDLNAPRPENEQPAAGTLPNQRFIAQASHEQPLEEDPANAQQGAGPFTLREWFVVGAGAVLLLLSFFSVVRTSEVGFFGPSAYLPVWRMGIDWVGAVLLPLLASSLLAARRFRPSLQRIGGLGIDQFASVAFAVTAYVWLAVVWNAFPYASPVPWLGLIVALAGLFFTALAPLVPPFSDDFAGRDEVLAHPTARPARPLARVRLAPAPAWDGQQAAPHPAGAPQQAPYGSVPTPWAQQHGPVAAPQQAGPPVAESAPQTTAFPVAPIVGSDLSSPAEETPVPPAEAAADVPGAAADVPSGDPVTQAAPVEDAAPSQTEEAPGLSEPDAGEGPASEPVAEAEATAAPQPFWALVPEERQVYDPQGQPGFRVGPTAWALVLEDRGDVFVIRHDDGRIGFLFDISGVTRG